MFQVVPNSTVPVCPNVTETGKPGPECSKDCPRSAFKCKDIPDFVNIALLDFCPHNKNRTIRSLKSINSKKILDCPFCGVYGTLLGDHEGFIVTCENRDCKVSPITDTAKTAEEAISWWNGLENND